MMRWIDGASEGRSKQRPYDPACHHRRSIRLPGYDYGQAGLYYVTVVTVDRACLLGHVEAGEMHLNTAGQAVLAAWEALPARFPMVEPEAIAIMPNHVHAIIGIRRGAACCAPLTGPIIAGPHNTDSALAGPPNVDSALAGPPNVDSAIAGQDHDDPGAAPSAQTVDGPTLGVVMRAWKSLSAAAVNRALGRIGGLWQRNYYEHIVRSDEELERIHQYLADNPARWALDGENPGAAQPV